MCIPKTSDTPVLFHLLKEKKTQKPKERTAQQKMLSHNLHSYTKLSPADGQASFFSPSTELPK